MRRAACLLILSLACCLAGCSAASDKQAFLNAQLTALEKQKPIWELEAQEGQTIELKGVKRISVYGQSGGPGQIRALQSEWAPVVREGLGILGTVGGIYYGGEQAVRLVEAAGRYAGSSISGSFNTSGGQSPVGFASGGGVSVNATSATTTSDNHSNGEK